MTWMKALPYLIALFGILSIAGLIYWKGSNDRHQKIELQTLTETVKDQKDLNEIRNNRPDADGVIKRLRSGTF